MADRKADGTFDKGASGNPGGKSAEREELRRYIHTFGRSSIDGIERLSRESASEKIKLAAYIWLAEQSIGRAVQGISGADGGALKIEATSGLMGVLKGLEGTEP